MDAGAGFIHEPPYRHLSQVFEMLENPFVWSGMLDDFPALIGNHDQIADGSFAHVNLIQNMVENQHGIPAQSEAPLVCRIEGERALCFRNIINKFLTLKRDYGLTPHPFRSINGAS